MLSQAICGLENVRYKTLNISIKNIFCQIFWVENIGDLC